LTSAGKDRPAIKAVFEAAREKLSHRVIDGTEKAFLSFCKALIEIEANDETIKAIAETQANFMEGFNSQIIRAQAGETTRQRWAARTRAIIAGWGRQAYIDGLADGGVVAEEGRRPDSVLDDDDKAKLKALNQANSKFVTDLGKVVFRGEGISEKQAQGKAQQWWNGSIAPYYEAGILSANANQMMEFVGDDGEKSCVTCRKLKGQRHRAKDIKRKGFEKEAGNTNFVCECHKCLHEWRPVKGRARGNWLKDAPGKWG
jgi:hypothetical protein